MNEGQNALGYDHREKKRNIIFLITLQLVTVMIFASIASSQIVYVAAKKPSQSPSSSNLLLPDLRPVKDTLMDYDLVKDPNTGHILLRFAAGV